MRPIKLLLIILVLAVLNGTAARADTDILSCSGNTCTAKIYRSDCPAIFSQYPFELIGQSDSNGNPVPIASSDTVTISYNSVNSTVVCDGTMQNFMLAAPHSDIQDQISCTVNPDRVSITATLVLYDQETYNNPFSVEPALSGYPQLTNTSPQAPYCIQETTPETATACKWEVEESDGATWLVYGKTTVSNISLGYAQATAGTTTLPADFCAQDLNNNGVIDSGEIGECPSTPQGYLCLIDAVKCTAATSDPICPTGGSLNTQTDKCEATPTISCSVSGFIYDSNVDKCVEPATCSQGILNTTTDRCEYLVASQCPSGFSYDSSADACVKAMSCPDGAVYDSSSDSCVLSATYSCPSGYTYNGTTERCEESPACPSGTSYNASLNECAKATILSCPAGFTLSGSVCQEDPTCPTGGSYNPSTKRCEVATSWKCASNGYTSGSQPTCNANCFITGNCAQNCTTKYCSGNYISGLSTFCTSTTCVPVSGGTCSASPCPACPGGTAPANSTVLSYWEYSCYYGVGSTQYYKSPAIYSYPSCSYKCSLSGTSYSTLSSCTSNCSQTQACDAKCPAGYSYDGTLCVASPTCSGGASFDSATDKCELQTTISCDTGFTYDSSSGYCVQTPSCPDGGVLDGSADVCALSTTGSCPSGFTYDGTSLCKMSGICSPGFYSTTAGMCEVSAASVCSAPFSFDSGTDVCYDAPTCTSGSTYSVALNECAMDAVHTCPSGYSYDSSTMLCEAYPICQSGTYDPTLNKCSSGDTLCPYGPSYTCMDYENQMMCSPYTCQDASQGILSTDTPTGAADKQNDGQVDSSTGQCLGNIYIFNGNDHRCRAWGWTIAFADCCKDKSYLFGLGKCSSSEIQLAGLKGDGLCHYVGEYCSKKLAIIGLCIEKKKTYCCFNSKLGRIIQEQGRNQLKTLSGWGDAKDPNCRGFTPEEFQMLDFSKIDLSEWYGDIKTSSEINVKNSVQQGVTSYYDTIK